MIRRFEVTPNLNFNVKEMFQKAAELAEKGKEVVKAHPVAAAAGTAATVGVLVGRNVLRSKSQGK